tara:strand:+ start:174 stop:803 length:630 start_codon:yes stop_codon:yes gene_type:complete
MPNKVTPTIEEAKELFKSKPHYKLKDWSKEWGVSIERVRQIKNQAGIVPMSEIDNNIVEVIVERIRNGESTLTNRSLYKDLPVGYDRFKTWMIKEPSIKEKCDLARLEFLSSDKSEKKCYKCNEILSIELFNKSQKYNDGYNRYCQECQSQIIDDREEVRKKTCFLCKKSLSPKSFNKNRAMKDGYSLFCKNCQSKERRSKRRLNNIIQ